MLIVCNQFLILISGSLRIKEIFIFAKPFEYSKLKSKIFSDFDLIKTIVMDINNLTCFHRICNILLIHERLTSKRITV